MTGVATAVCGGSPPSPPAVGGWWCCWKVGDNEAKLSVESFAASASAVSMAKCCSAAAKSERLERESWSEMCSFGRLAEYEVVVGQACE